MDARMADQTVGRLFVERSEVGFAVDNGCAAWARYWPGLVWSGVNGGGEARPHLGGTDALRGVFPKGETNVATLPAAPAQSLQPDVAISPTFDRNLLSGCSGAS